jgi:predicted ATPase
VKHNIMKRQSDSYFYFWAHSKLQQAAFSLIPEDERDGLRLGLGKLLFDMSSRERYLGQEVLLYVAADQLNQVNKILLSQEGEDMRFDLARLNLQAAKLSISKSAFYPAVELLRTGISQLCSGSAEMWSEHYDLSLELYNLLLENEYTIGNQEEAKVAIDQVLKQARSSTDKFRAQSCLLDITTNGKDRCFDRGVAMCLEILQGHGIKLPNKPTNSLIAQAERRLTKSLPNGKLEDLLHMSLMEDKVAVCISVFLGKIANFTVLVQRPELGKLAALKAFQLACAYGINTYIVLAMTLYSYTFRLTGDNDKCFSLADLAGDLLRKLSPTPGANYAKILVIIHSSMIPLKKPLQDSLVPFMEAYEVGIQTGDVEYALIGAMSYGYNYLFSGLPLAPLESDMKGFGQESRHFGLAPSIQVQFPIFQQTVLNLQGKGENPSLLDGGAMDQIDLLSQVEGQGKSMTFRDICLFQLMLTYVFRDVDTAKQMLDALSTFPKLNPAITRSHLRQAFTGLWAFTLSRQTGKKKYKKLARSALKYFKVAVKKGSLNAYPIYSLLLAEQSRNQATYDDAIRVCSRSGLMNFEAMANESAALYFFEEGDEDWGMSYMSKALHLYQDWGAMGKAKQLREQYEFQARGADHRVTNRSIQGRRNYKPSATQMANKVLFDEISSPSPRTKKKSLKVDVTEALLRCSAIP